MNRFIVERVLRRERERKSENKEGPRSRSERESKARRPSSCIFVSFPPPLGTDQSPLPLPDARHWTRGIRSRAHGRERLEKRARGREQGRGTCCEVDALSKSIESLVFFRRPLFVSFIRSRVSASLPQLQTDTPIVGRPCRRLRSGEQEADAPCSTASSCQGSRRRRREALFFPCVQAERAFFFLSLPFPLARQRPLAFCVSPLWLAQAERRESAARERAALAGARSKREKGKQKAEVERSGIGTE